MVLLENNTNNALSCLRLPHEKTRKYQEFAIYFFLEIIFEDNKKTQYLIIQYKTSELGFLYHTADDKQRSLRIIIFMEQ